jgi:nucleoside-diphosphate-sugar epimerase
MARLAITGGTGFVGGHLIDAALAAGHEVRALARRTQPARPGVIWVAGALADVPALAELVAGADAVIHVAGVINARDRASFDAGNVEGTRVLLAASQAVPRFIQVSSLAARAPSLSHYGASKAAADALVAAARPDASIVRPPAVYGPGDRETAQLFRMIAGGLAPLPGRGRLSLIEVTDLCRALLALAMHPAGAGGVFEIDDGTPQGFSQRQFAALIADALGVSPLYVTLPRWLLTAAAGIDTLRARLTGGLPRLSFDRARYFAHPDWTANSAPLRALGIWQPEVAASDGIAGAARWYRERGWI